VTEDFEFHTSCLSW